MFMPVILLIFAIIGLLFSIYHLFQLIWYIIQGLRCFVFPNFTNGHGINLVEKYGPWAVVTGSTDGIGKAYAEELAKRGLNLVLISRNPEKLCRVASEFAKYNVNIKVIAVDFSLGKSLYADIKRQLAGIEIGILVNNVGSQYSYPMYIGEVPESQLWDIININIGATVLMTTIVLEGMLQRNKGAIVNVSSASELQPLPLMTLYSSSKTFVMNFTAGIKYEYRHTGITIQHLAPFFVNTNMNAFSYSLQNSSLIVPEAITYARNAVNTLGRADSTTGYWSHGIQYYFTELAPIWLRTLIGDRLNQKFRQDYFKGLTNRA